MEQFTNFDWLWDLLPSLLAGVLTLAAMHAVYRVIHDHWDRSVRRDIVHGLAQLVLGVAGILAVILLLPVEQQTRDNILTAGGLILSLVVGFSSTNIIKDAAAGVTLRFIAPFRHGDYLSAGKYFGRISDIGFFHTEIQSKDRSLVTLSNAQLLNAPFEVFPSTGTVLNTEVSLGYDIARHRIEDALLEAAEATGLTDPFVHVEELGDYSVTYKVAGLLTDNPNLLTARSDFRKNVIDSLHEHDIEIVSPIFQNQRKFAPEKRFIGEVRQPSDGMAVTEADEIVFDKALNAREVEDLDELVADLKERLDNEDLGEATKQKLERRIEIIERRKEKYEEMLAERD